jgi:hypothetical protein
MAIAQEQAVKIALVFVDRQVHRRIRRRIRQLIHQRTRRRQRRHRHLIFMEQFMTLLRIALIRGVGMAAAIMAVVLIRPLKTLRLVLVRVVDLVQQPIPADIMKR